MMDRTESIKIVDFLRLTNEFQNGIWCIELSFLGIAKKWEISTVDKIRCNFYKLNINLIFCCPNPIESESIFSLFTSGQRYQLSHRQKLYEFGVFGNISFVIIKVRKFYLFNFLLVTNIRACPPLELRSEVFSNLHT